MHWPCGNSSARKACALRVYSFGRSYSFLSCLFGSELQKHAALPDLAFLSCLFGSELDEYGYFTNLEFLSCLFGSELVRKK